MQLSKTSHTWGKKHITLMRDDAEYKALIDFIEDNQPVSAYHPELDRWSPMKYPNVNGPLTIAEVITKAIILDNESEEFILADWYD